MSAQETLAAELYEHWGAALPRDETECCAEAGLKALAAAGYAVVKLPEPVHDDPGRHPYFPSAGVSAVQGTVWSEEGEWTGVQAEQIGAEMIAAGRLAGEGLTASWRRHRTTPAIATVRRVRAANELIHAHRFDLNSSDPAGHKEWLATLGEKSAAGGPDSFYHGITFAHRRITRALDETGGEIGE
ncbi:hypothetical protein [Gordonia malaquae]|uniref:hypothetical protein n=1 Tax=Gordonia malaquae TaxID=410332 RepID=UPI003018E030